MIRLYFLLHALHVSDYISPPSSPARTVPPLSHLTSCAPTMSNLYLANSLAAAVSEPALYRLLTFHVPTLMSLFLCLTRDASSRNTPP